MIAALAVVFGWVLPRFIDYDQVWAALTQLDAGEMAVLLGVALARIPTSAATRRSRSSDLGTRSTMTRFRSIALALLAVTAALLGGPRDVTGSARGGPDSKRAAGWTTWIDADLSARRLGLPPRAPAPKLARAALRRHAERLGLPVSLRGVRVARSLHVPDGRQGATELDLMR